MKKLLTFLLTALLAFGVGWAETEETITMALQGWTNGQSVSSVTSGDVTITFNKGTSNTAPAYYTTGYGVRLYNGGSYMTVTAGSSNTISNIVLTFSATTYTGTFSSDVGSYSLSSATGTWTGSASSVTLTNTKTGSGHARLQKVVVTYSSGGSTTVTPPTISPAGGIFATSQQVTLSHDDYDAIYYTLDGNDPTTSSTQYNAPFTLTSTTTVKAIAVKDGVSSSPATATFTKAGVANIAEANVYAENGEFIFTGNAVVTYYKEKNGNHYIWLRDLNATSGGGVLYNPDNNVTTQGAVLTPDWHATRTLYNTWSRYTSATGISQNNDYSTQTVEPFDRTEVSLTDAHMNEYIVLNGVTLSGSGNNWTATTGSRTTHTLYNQFGVAGLTDGKTYNIKGAVTKYNGDIQVYILEAEEVASQNPLLEALPTTLTINDSGTDNTFTVEGSNLGSDNVGLTQNGSYFTPSLSTTTGWSTDGGTYWYFTPNNGSLNGTVAMSYTGRELSASETVTLANNVASATVTVNYRADVYILGNYGSGWDYSDGILMTYNNGIYTASVTADVGDLIVFARKLGESNPWNTRILFGPNSDGDWWVNSSPNPKEGTIDLNDDDPIYFNCAGTYTIEINATTGALTVTREAANTGDFELVTNVNDLNAGDEVIIVNKGEASNEARTMGERTTNNYRGTAVTVTSNLKVSPTSDTQIFTLEAGTGGWYFKTSDNLYLNSTTGNSNNLQTKAKDGNGTGTSLATISIGSGSSHPATIVFQGTGSRKNLRYNVNNLLTTDNGYDIFSCYGSGQADVFIYKRTASTEPSITVNPSTINIVIPAGSSSEQGTATVTEENTTGTTSVSSITGTGASYFSAQVNNGTLTVTYNGTADQANPDVAIVNLANGTATATVNVTGYKEPITVTITPADGHTFQGSTVTGMIESNVAGATLEYSFDGTNWTTYDANDGFTATVNKVGGTVTVYARATYNGETATAQATYTRIAPSTTCTADIVFDPETNGGGVTQWSTLRDEDISEGADYISTAEMATVYTAGTYDAMRFGSSNNTGYMTFTLDLSKFETGACKLTKVTINAARYSNDTGCELNVSTSVNTTGVTQSITADQTNFADYVFNFIGSEITTLTIANTAAGSRVYVHSITLEYSCGSSVQAPVIIPDTDTYYEDKTVHMSADDGCTIYFTTNGSDPTTSSSVFTDDFNIGYNAGSTTTIKAIAVDGDGIMSDVTTVVYTWGVPSVHIHPDSRNTTASSVNVTLTPSPADATVYYTTDGSTPTTSSAVYEGPFTVDIPNVGDQTTVKAIAVKGATSSAVATATYTHVENVLDVHAPFFSPLVNHNYYGDQTLEIGCTTPNADIYYEIYEVSGSTAPSASDVEDPTHVSSHFDGSTIEMTVGNSYYVKAIAYVGNNPSTIAEGWYTIMEAPTTQYTYTNLKDFNDHCPTGVTAHFVNPVQVVYHSTYTNNGEYAEFCYLRDNTDYACVYFGKRDTNGYTIFNMGDWIDGSQIAGVTNIWERNFHIQLGTGNHEVSSWPSQAIGWSEILPEDMTCNVIVAGTSEGDNVWGHYVHLRNTRLSNVDDYSSTDPKHTGLINDGTANAYYYDKFYRWSAGTCSYDGHNDQINCLGDYDQDFFTTKQNAGATFDVYGVIDYYSLYTPPFEVCPIDFLWAYKPVMTPATTTSYEPVTVNITATQPEWAADGVVIYYKTDDMEEWAVYTGPITVNSTTTIQAYAEVPAEKTNGTNYNDYVRSEILTETYTIEGIEDPTITAVPDVNVIEVVTGNESVTVTVTDHNEPNSGAVTTYTVNGVEYTLQAGQSVDIVVTSTTTITAVSSVVNGEHTLYSNEVSETYEFIVSNDKTYDLLTTNPVVGNIYVIVNKADQVGLSTTQNANNRAGIGVTFNNDKTVVNGNTSLAEFILESANAGRYYFRQVGTQNYLCVTTNEYANLMTGAADVNAEANATVNSSVTSGVDESYPATVTFYYDGTPRYLRYYSNNRTFTTYGDATANQDIFLYGIAAPVIYDPAIDPITQVVPVTTGYEFLNVYIVPNDQNAPGAVTYYTTDGSDPRDPNSNRQIWNENSQAEYVNTNTTVKAATCIEFADTEVWSNVVSETYTFIGIQPPVIDPESGSYWTGQEVMVNIIPDSSNPSGTVTYYTTDGSDPRDYGTVWNGQQFSVNVTTTVKAVSCYIEDNTPVWSVIVEETYTFQTPEQWPLNKIESEGETEVCYTVADDLIGAWAVYDPANGINQLWAKDMGLSIDKTSINSDINQKDYMMDVLHYQNNPWDQSNWVILDFNGLDGVNAENYVGQRLSANSVTGIYTNSVNYSIMLVVTPESTATDASRKYPGYGADPMTDEPEDYELGYNTYSPANFLDANLNAPYGEGFTSTTAAAESHVGEHLFFMNPKVQEVARVWAVYAGMVNGKDLFTVYQTDKATVNGYALEGAFNVNWTYNRLMAEVEGNDPCYGKPENMADIINEPILFHAVIEKKSGNKFTAQGQADPTPSMSERYVVSPLDIQNEPEGNVTSVKDVKGVKEVESVRFYNIMGQESKSPFEGINIVVTRYTDGSSSTAKVLR